MPIVDGAEGGYAREMRTSAFIAGAIVITASQSFGQESVPLEEARDAARKLNAVLAAETATAVQIEADTEKPCAIRGGEVGLMIVPDRRLNSAQFDALTAEISPVGQLWTRKASLAVNNQPATRDQVRVVSIEDDGGTKRDVELYLLGAKKNEKGQPELLLYGKGKEPLLRVPISVSKDATTQTSPIELSGRKNDENSGTLTLRFAGGSKAEFVLTRPAQ